MDLTPCLKPKSIVIIGISTRNPNHPGNTIFTKNCYETRIKTYGVNEKGGFYEGQPLYRSVKELPEIPDLAILAVTSDKTLPIIKECIELGIKGFVHIGGGFAEIGEYGKIIQDQMSEMCRKANVPLIGPNGLGVYSPPFVDTFFLPTERIYKPPKGNIGIISQSGGVLIDQFFLSCHQRNIGVSFACSIGNKAVISEEDFIDYVNDDPETDAIIFYIEGFEVGRGRKFLEKAWNCKKDIIVYPGGQSVQASLAVQSHSASLAVNNRLAMDAYRQYAVTIVRNEIEAMCSLQAFSSIALQKKLPVRINYDTFLGDGLAIITVSGGHGVICVDIASRYNMNLAKLEKTDMNQLKSVLNPKAAAIASLNNPFDLTGSCTDEDIVNIISESLDLDRIKCIVALLLPYPANITMLLGRKIINMLSVKKEISKPIIFFVPWVSKYDLIRDPLIMYNLPVCHTIEETIITAAAIKTRARGLMRKNNCVRRISKFEDPQIN